MTVGMAARDTAARASTRPLRRRRGAISSWFFGAALALGGVASAENVTFETSNGHRLVLPPIAKIESDCASIRSVLREIDATGYRMSKHGRSIDPLDVPLFEYEDTLAKIDYRDCSSSHLDRASPQAAGFKSFVPTGLSFK